eukprot:gene30114-34048_t
MRGLPRRRKAPVGKAAVGRVRHRGDPPAGLGDPLCGPVASMATFAQMTTSGPFPTRTPADKSVTSASGACHRGCGRGVPIATLLWRFFNSCNLRGKRLPARQPRRRAQPMILSRYERMIARRYLLPGKGEGFIFLVAGISLVAVMLGVAALVIVMSVMNGFRAELFDKIVGLNGHAVVQAYGGQMRDWRQVVGLAEATKGVTSATPLIEQPLMGTYNGRVEGVLVRGMRVSDIRSNKAIGSKVVMGSLSSLMPGSGQIAIGSGLADQLGAVVGSQISLISPQGQTTPFGTVPRIVQYTVGAIFTIGVYDYDKAYVVMPMEDAQTLL